MGLDEVMRITGHTTLIGSDPIRTLCVKDHPGILMNIHYDENGDIDRESFLVTVQNQEQVITGILPPLHAEWFERCK